MPSDLARTATERLPDPSLLPAIEVAAAVDVDPASGLTAAEASDRLARLGPNELRSAPPVPLWRRILAQFADPLVYLLLVAVAISVVAWVAEGAEGVPVDAIVIVAVLLANAAIGLAQEAKAAILGAVAGYYGRWVDTVIMRFVDIMLCFPTFFLILAVIAILEPSIWNIMIIIGATGWMG